MKYLIYLPDICYNKDIFATMYQSNQQLQLLRQYVKTLQNQMASKNEEIKTLNLQIQSLLKNQNSSNASNISRSQVIYTSNCHQCSLNKQQLNDIKAKYALLQSSAHLPSSKMIYSCIQCPKYKKEAQQNRQKYQSLLKSQSSSSVRTSQVIYSSSLNCNQCSSLKTQLQQLQQKYNMQFKQLTTNYSSFVSSSSTNEQIQYFKRQYLKILDQKKIMQRQMLQLKMLSQRTSSNIQIESALKIKAQQLLTLRLQLHKKDEIIRQLKSQLTLYSQKITNLQTQIQSLARSNSHTQINSDRLKYLNGQVQHYLALSNSLKSQIQVLKQQNHNYILKIRQLQSQPKQVEYIQIEPSFDFRQSISDLRRQIADLTNNNLLIQQQNQNLHLRVLELSRSRKMEPQIIQVIRTQNHSPIRRIIQEERVGRHYKKSQFKDYSRAKQLTSTNTNYFQHQKYNDLQRRIHMLQAENDNLKNNFYIQI